MTNQQKAHPPSPQGERRDILIATHNEGKVHEFEALFRSFSVRLLSAYREGLPSPEETGHSFQENALIKARCCFDPRWTVLADDSGLEVEALGGFPGVHSARFAQDCGGFQQAMAALTERLEGQNHCKARFVCVLALITPEGHESVFEGEVRGTLLTSPQGNRGFGYDPLFVPEGCTHTFGDMDPQKKDTMSHRGRAFAHLTHFMFS